MYSKTKLIWLNQIKLILLNIKFILTQPSNITEETHSENDRSKPLFTFSSKEFTEISLNYIHCIINHLENPSSSFNSYFARHKIKKD